MKKILSLVLSLAVVLSLCACGSTATDSDQFNIVCASFAEYDWVKNLTVGTEAQVTIIADTGTDMHSYQPTAADVLAIGKADLVVYNGGTADGWMTAAIKNSGFDGVSVRLMDVLADRLLHLADSEEHDHGHDEHCEYDEHLWLSLKNAVIACRHLTKELSAIDGANKAVYSQNCADYVEKLEALDADYQSTADTARVKSVVFADRFPFIYLMNDYGIAWQAAFPGCSAETDADFEKVITLSKWVDSQSIDTIFIIEGSDKALAQTVISNTKAKNQQIVTLDSMQSVTKKTISSGKSYLGVMTANLNAVKKALH